MKKFDPRTKITVMHMLQDYSEGGDLNDYLTKTVNTPMQIDQIKNFAGQLISAICYLHDRDILHGDLKPANILMSKDHKTLKVTDLGFSRFLKNGTMKTNRSENGTPYYMAPE